jgi:hypothetical protein
VVATVNALSWWVYGKICKIVTRLIGRDSTLPRNAHDVAIILLLWILPLPALPQTSTDDGVRAFVRGDYASASG